MAGKKYSKKNIIGDRDIDLYCQSVEQTLDSINKKNKARRIMEIITDEFEFENEFEFADYEADIASS
jgi:hypothetical protein